MASPKFDDVLNGGGSFLANEAEDIFIPEDFDSDSLLMIDTAKQFMRREVLPHLEALDKQEPGLMPGLMRKAGQLGLTGIETQVEYGGLGLPKTIGTRIIEMLSLNGSFSTTIAVHGGIGQAPIAMWGSPEQKQKYLPKLTSGEWMGAYALSEPNSGSDALGLAARALPDGNRYRLSGTKMWISNAKWADLFIVFARTDDDKVSAFLVERDFPGVSIGAEEHKLGLKGSSTARLVLDDVPVPAENLLYHKGEGHRVALNALNLGRLKLGAMSLGPARSAIELSARYARDRKQFGKPVAEFGLVRDKFARMGALFFATESVLYRTCDLVDRALSKVDPASDTLADDNRKATEVYAIECSLTKVLSTEVLAFCADEAIQIHGGYGFTEEFPVARLWRDARVTRIYEGTNEINRLFVIDRIAKKGLLECLLACEPKEPVHFLLVEAAKAAVSHYGAEVARKQEVAGRLSDLVMILYAQQSASRRADRLRAADHPLAEFARAAADYYIGISTAEAVAAASEVFGRTGETRTIEVPTHDYSGTDLIAATILDKGQYPFG